MKQASHDGSSPLWPSSVLFNTTIAKIGNVPWSCWMNGTHTSQQQLMNVPQFLGPNEKTLHCLFPSLSLTLTGRANNSKPFTMNFQVSTLYILQSITDTNQQQPHLAGTRRKNWKQQYESITDTRVVDMPITHTHPWPNKCLNSPGIGWWSNGPRPTIIQSTSYDQTTSERTCFLTFQTSYIVIMFGHGCECISFVKNKCFIIYKMWLVIRFGGVWW